jgi:hypothetical protein
MGKEQVDVSGLRGILLLKNGNCIPVFQEHPLTYCQISAYMHGSCRHCKIEINFYFANCEAAT